MARGFFENPARIRKQRIRRNTVIFYIVYFLILGGLCFGLKLGLDRLAGWLADYEAAQPKTRCQEIFDELFSVPDWAELYSLAGLKDTQYETGETFARYMAQKSQGKELSYYETSAGLSGDHKYVVRLGDEKAAVFTLTVEDPEAEIPKWVLGSLELFPEFSTDVTVCTAPDRTVYINGVALTDEHTVKTLSTAAEEYLSEGIHGMQRRWQYVDKLLIAPQVTVLDSAGNPVELIYDGSSNTYSEIFPEVTVSDEEISTVVNAAKIYCKFMIGAANRTSLGLHFDSATDIYRSIIASETWMQNYTGYSFSDYTVSGYYPYSDSLYSLKLTMSLNVTRTNGTTKEYALDTTFFMQKNSEGVWKVTDMTNVDVQQQTVTVRLTCMVGDTLLETRMVDASGNTLQLPAVTVPEGKSFAGWYRQSADAAGNITYSLTFVPDENGTVYLSQDTVLEPMTLYALFDNKEAP